MKKFQRAVLTILLMAGFTQTIQAENANPDPRNSAISGRVIDSVHQTLPGASIYIEKLQTGVISDINGFYTLPNLEPWKYVVKVTYVGFEPVEATLTVKAGKTLEYDIVMNECWNMSNRYYTKVYEEDGTSVRLVMVDTTPFMNKYREDKDKYPDACKQDNAKQLAWVDSVLTSAKEDWVIVIGHHPIYAETTKAERERLDMQQTLGKVLRKHKQVAMYLCGHIHNFQHLQVKGSSIDYVVNSSASLSRKVNPIEGTVFCSPEPGFSVIAADKKELCLHMIDKNGNILHSVKKQK